MRKRMWCSLLIAITLIFTMIPVNVFAEGDEESGNDKGVVAADESVIMHTAKINGIHYSGGDESVFKKGEEVVLSIEDVTLDGQAPDPADVSYQWRFYDDQGKENIIQGAVSSSYTFQFSGIKQYDCVITVGDVSMGSFFELKEDTLTVTATANPQGALDEDDIYQIKDVSLGQTVDLAVEATSINPGADMTYKWSYMVLATEDLPEDMGIVGNKCTFTKKPGVEVYSCEVSDGNVTKYVYFYISPKNTLNVTPVMNGINPERFERGYMFVAKPGTEVTMTPGAVSSEGTVTYRWEKREYDSVTGQPIVTDLGISDTITVTKSETDNDDLRGFEQYECYIQDGNEIENVGFVLFSLEPYQVKTEVESDSSVPSISINNTPEDLSNDLLKDSLNALSLGTTAQVTLTAETQDALESEEENAVNEILPGDSEVGMYLDLNLYKKVDKEGEKTQITETQTAINLSVDIPEDLINSDNNASRDYQIIRVHEGEAEILDCQYDKDNERVTFNTDKFSTYVLAYSDETSGHIHGDTEIINEKQPTCTEDGYTGDKICKECKAVIEKGHAISKLGHNFKNGKCTVCGAADPNFKLTKSDASSSNSPKTGDTTNMAGWIILLVASGVGLISLFIYRRKHNYQK